MYKYVLINIVTEKQKENNLQQKQLWLTHAKYSICSSSCIQHEWPSDEMKDVVCQDSNVRKMSCSNYNDCGPLTTMSVILCVWQH
jgi:hypothetical protein